MTNCELRRNLWLEFAPLRLLISPLIFIAIVVIIYLSVNTARQFFDTLLYVSGLLTGLILMLWAVVQASDSVISEVNNRTWVFQRMSSVTAWDMALGKLFGSTAYSWYCGAFCLLAYFIAALNYKHSGVALKFGLLLILVALALQASSILTSLIMVKNDRFTGRAGKNSIILIGAIIGMWMMSATPMLFEHGTLEEVAWFGWRISLIDFALWSALYAVVWSVTGLYRVMRAELQYDNTPIVWCCFIPTFLCYIDGLLWNASGTREFFHGNLVVWGSFVILVLLSYFTVGIESFDTVAMRKVIDRASKGHFKDAAVSLPLWVPTAAIMLVAALVVLANELIAGPSVFIVWERSVETKYVLSFLPITLVLLFARDLGIMGLIKATGSPKADFYVLIYLASIYGLLPTIINLMNMGQLVHFFWPVPTDGFAWQVGPAMLEVMGVAFLVMNRRYRLMGKG